MLIVLLSGKMGSGKSSLKSALLEQLQGAGVVAAALRFAQPVYDAHDAALDALIQYGIPAVVKDRVLLQLIGTEWGRVSRGADIWVRALAHRATEEMKRCQVIVIDDARFQNELNHDYGFPKLTIRLEVPEAVRESRFSYPLSNHISETALDKEVFDICLKTGGVSTPHELALLLLPDILAKLHS